MAEDLTYIFEPHRDKIFGELQQANKGVGILAVQQEFPDRGVDFGKEVRFDRRPRATTMDRSDTPGINDFSVEGPVDPNETNLLTIDQKIQGYGGVLKRGYAGSGLEFLDNKTARMEVMRMVKSAVNQCSNDLLKKFMDPVTGIMNDVSMAVNVPEQELFQSVDPGSFTGAPWQGVKCFGAAAEVLDERGNDRAGRLALLSNSQRHLYNGAAFSSDIDKAGSTTARNFQSMPVDTSGLIPYTQFYTPQSITASTYSAFGYASVNDPATATIAATPAVRDLAIDITAGAGAPLDLKAGDLLYFTPTAQPLPDSQRGRVQGYVVAADTAIPATTTVSVPITRSIRYDPFEPATSGNPGVPDVQAGLYLRGMVSHSVGFALQRDAVVLMLVDPYASHISAEYGGPTAVGGVLATATISDASIEEGGSGLSFFMRILAGTEGWELRVDAWAGWHVVRPESILRIASPAL